MIAPYPIDCHTLTSTYITIHHLFSDSQGIRFIPSDASALLIKPVFVANSVETRPPMITHERKCGKYSIVCVTFLKFRLFNSFNISANKIGAGKLNTKHNTFSRIVLTIARENSLIANSFLKFWSPHHALSAIPLKML